MIGAPSNEIPKWSPVLAPTAVICHHHHHQQEDSTFISLSPSPNIHLAAFAASLQRYVPRNNNNGDICREDCWSDGDFHDVIDDIVDDGNDDDDDDDDDMPLVDALTCDEFRMYEFKVRQCARSRSHDWMQCPYAHPGEKARRRDPRKYHYCGTPCPEFRKGNCRKGDSCEFAHGVFECWLHPSRYRTQPCKDGVACRRRVCFFAHVPEELRVLPSVGGYDGSPVRKVRSAAAAATAAGGGGVALSPTSNLMGPVSPSGSSGVGSPPASATLEEVMLEMTNLQLRKKAREAGMRWDWRHRQLQRMGYNWTRGFDGWRGDRVPENASTVVESSVDEPAWFSDIVN